MKKYLIYISASVCILVSFQTLRAQNQNISDYLGTWRWVSGNKDTFLIVLLPGKKDMKPGNAAPTLIGYHTYIEKGQLVESNIKEIEGTDTTIFSITGVFQGNQLNISWFRDFTRDRTLKGSFQIIPGLPKKAVWDLPFMYEKFIYQGMGMREYPPGRTVPNNIVLEKIS